jgi:hypothetical protein
LNLDDDEVVTGGGYEFDVSVGLSFGSMNVVADKASGNGWSVSVILAGGNFRAFAECAHLEPVL